MLYNCPSLLSWVFRPWCWGEKTRQTVWAEETEFPEALGKEHCRERELWRSAKDPSSSQYSNDWYMCIRRLPFKRIKGKWTLHSHKRGSYAFSRDSYRINISSSPPIKSLKQDLKELNGSQVSELCLRPKLKKISKNKKNMKHIIRQNLECLTSNQKLWGMHAKKQENMNYNEQKI